MSIEKMREEFEAAFVENEVRLCGEGMRGSALYMIETDVVTVRIGWWAWQASRAAVVVELPSFSGYRDHVVRELQAAFKYAAEAQGLRVKHEQ